MHKLRPSLFRSSLVALPVALLGALLMTSCSKGGTRKQQTGEVKLPDEVYNYVYLGGNSSLSFPLKFVDARIKMDSRDWANEGTMTFGSTSQYTLTQVGKTTVKGQDYYLKKAGDLIVLSKGRSATTLRMPGFVDLTGDLFFFVRNTRPAKGSWPVLFFAGVKQSPGLPVMTGSWSHMGFSLVRAGTKIKKDHNEVARTFEGTVVFDLANKVSAATWKDSSRAASTLTGLITPKKGGEVDLVYTIKSGLYTGTSSWTGFVGKHLAMLYDGSEKDGDLGLAFLVREMTANVDKTKLKGSYSVVNYAMLSSADAQGADIALGKAVFNEDLSFTITLSGPMGTVKYKGSYKIGVKGRITLEVTDGNQSWFAVVTPDYKNLVFVDSTWEKIAPELGLYLGIRIP